MADVFRRAADDPARMSTMKLLAAVSAVAASAVLLLSGCTDTTPAAPDTPTATSDSGSSQHGSSEHGTSGSSHPTTHPTTHTTTPTPTSGHYDPNNCPSGLVCSPSGGGGSTP